MNDGRPMDTPGKSPRCGFSGELWRLMSSAWVQLKIELAN